MPEFLNELFDRLEDAQEKDDKNIFSPSSSGEEEIKFQIDENGESEEVVSRRGFGVTIEFTATIKEPEGQFDIQVITTGEGGLDWTVIQSNQAVTFKIKMLGGLSKTNVTVQLKSGFRNQTGRVLIVYRRI